MAHVNKKRAGLYLSPENDEKISNYAEELGISKQKLMENLIDSGLDDLALLKRTGFLAIGKGFRDLVYKLRKEGESVKDSSELTE